MTPDLGIWARLARETAKGEIANAGAPLLKQATVRASGNSTIPGSGRNVPVVIDGLDSEPQVIAQNMTGRYLTRGERVMVEFRPPMGIFIVGMSDKEPIRLGVTVRRVANQVIPTTTTTSVDWDTRDYDPDLMLVGLPGLNIYFYQPGVWSVDVWLYLSAVGTRVFAQLLYNGVEIERVAPVAADGTAMRLGFANRVIPVGDPGPMVVRVFQQTGGNSNLTARFEATRIGPATDGT